MAVIKTGGGMVCAIPALDGDCWIEVWHGANRLGRLPIDQCEAAIEWAIPISREFVLPLQIIPISPSDLANSSSYPRPGGDVTTPEQRHEDRRAVVNAMCEVLRDCDDPEVRAEAFDVLVTMKVVQP